MNTSNSSNSSNTSTNNNNVASSLLPTSIYLLNQQLIWNILVFMIVAPMASLANMFILCVLFKGRYTSFKSHHYKLLAHMALGSTLLSMNSFIFIGLKRLYVTMTYSGEIMTTLTCGMWLAAHELFLGVDSFNIMVVALDRFIAVAFPIRYKNVNLHFQYKILTILVPWMFSLANIFYKYGSYTKDFANSILVICILASTRPKDQGTLVGIVNYAVCTLTVILYMCGITVAGLKIFKATKNATKMKKELGLRLIITSGTDGIINCSMFFAGALFVTIYVSKAPIITQIVFGPISFGFYLLALTARPLVMLTLNKEFRKVFKSKFTMNRITTINVATTNTFATTTNTFTTTKETVA